MNDVSVVISVFSVDRANDVIACVDSLKKQSMVTPEIIVVLDPNDELVRFYKEKLTDVKIVVSPEFGLSFARNEGVINSQSEIIAFIDDDAVADEKWLEALTKNYDDQSVIGVGGRIEPVWAGVAPAWFPEELYWIVGCSYKGLPAKKAVIRNPIGCNMSFRRCVIEKVGYFDTGVGRIGDRLLGHDDTEFGIRAAKTFPESKIIYEPEAIVYHHVPKKRSKLKYLLERSYAEGYSKAFFLKYGSGGKSQLGAEQQYLRMLFVCVPSKFFQFKLRTSFTQTSALLISILMVFMGYINGLGSD